MSDELKPCSICGSPGIQMWDPEENIIKCSNDSFCHNALYGMYFKEWQNRPLEDSLEKDLCDLKDELKEVTAVGMRDGLVAIAWYQKYTELKHNLASSLEAARWIPVGERLPEDGQPVLGYTPDGVFMMTLTEDAWFDVAGFSWFDEGEFPTHWRPLPAPPQEIDAEEVPQQ